MLKLQKGGGIPETFRLKLQGEDTKERKKTLNTKHKGNSHKLNDS